jgi:DNA invertase Pin-like site-specific DNA recombinase
MEGLGVMVWSLSPNESFTRQNDPNVRQLLLMIMSWVAQRERDNLVSRTKAGIDRARAEGHLLGRPRADIDFEKLRMMRAEGMSWEDISKELGYPTMTIFRARKRRGEI